MKTRIKNATAEWDTTTGEPGWLVTIETHDGHTDTRAPAPAVYQEDEDADPEEILAATLEWEGLEIGEPAAEDEE